MDNKHTVDAALHELVSHPALGRLVATITGASMVQVFATQALIKPSGRAEVGNVGWHQDLQYWQEYLRGELMTVWVAVSDVKADSGPMRFVRGSHDWGMLNVGNFFSGNLDALRESIVQKHDGRWEEVPAILAPGGASVHHCLTIHGSGPNHLAWHRKSVAIHVRTNQSALVEGVKFKDVGWLNDFADENACPVMFRAVNS
jgi:ectoine hydroxylase-related dioxygenase (phytanoyl-CoA dioxygenase family)